MVDYWWFDSMGYAFYFMQRLLYRYLVFLGVTFVFGPEAAILDPVYGKDISYYLFYVHHHSVVNRSLHIKRRRKMKSIKIVVVFMFVMLGCFTMACSEHRIYRESAYTSDLTPLNYSQYGRPPIPVKILLLIPDEFDRFELLSNYKTGGTRYILGRDAEREMKEAFGIEFAKVEVLHVQSEDTAMEMLSPNDPKNAQVRAYDYVAIPKFLHADSMEDHEKYGFEIDLQVEFYAINGSSVTIKGHGKSMMEMYAESTREKGANLTVQYAVSALLDGIEKQRDFFLSQ